MTRLHSLRAVTLCALASVAGCAQTTTQARLEKPAVVATAREVLHAFECEIEDPDAEDREERENQRWYAALQLGLAVDHVRLAHHGSETDQYIFAAQGEACSTANDKAACQAKLAELEALGHAHNQVFAITIKGDELKLYQEREVYSLLGPIDNVYKAWLVLMVHDDIAPYMCHEPEWDGFRETADGYDLATVWTEKTCRPFQRLQAISHVSRAGRVTRLRTNIVEHEPDACLVH